jgi:ATPase family associated with various cellular activities (AAA)
MDWQEYSNQYLSQEIFRLQQQIEKILDPSFEIKPLSPLLTSNQAGETPQSALETLCAAFKLSDLEKDILILCVGAEIDFRCCQLLGKISDNPQNSLPTIFLALNISQHRNLTVFDRNLSIFRWQLVHIQSNNNLITAPLKVDPWVLQHVMGYRYQDPTYPANLHPKPLYSSKHPLPAIYSTLIETIALQWDSANTSPLIQLCGADPKAHHLIAAEVSRQYGYEPMRINASAFNQDRDLLKKWLIHWKRQATLYNQILLLEISESDTQSLAISQTLTQLIATQSQPLFLSLPERLQTYSDTLSLDVPDLNIAEQKQQWAYHLGDHAPDLKDDIGKIVAQFNTTLHNIATITNRAIAQIENPREGITPKPLPDLVWQICRTESRSRLEGLVERIEPKTTWDDLILPPLSEKELKGIIAACQNRSTVHDQWGMGGKTHRGMGISSLFHGPSGTGKTTASEIIAHDLELDLYRVDLSQVSSKYIGETEKNLKKIFDAAQESGAVLLFDEADSIIGKRSEVKDARDHYVEVAANLGELPWD